MTDRRRIECACGQSWWSDEEIPAASIKDCPGKDHRGRGWFWTGLVCGIVCGAWVTLLGFVAASAVWRVPL